MTEINRLPSTTATDSWLTPPELLSELGLFDLDPCCPPVMPWSSAMRMIHFPQEDGLKIDWAGRVWCNPPFSTPLLWIDKMAAHGNGIMLLPAKSPETKWGQRLLLTGDLFLFQRGRMLFHYVDGLLSTGKWSPHVLVAYGEANVEVLAKASRGIITPGVLLRRVE